jgi:hypothetical protein
MGMLLRFMIMGGPTRMFITDDGNDSPRGMDKYLEEPFIKGSLLVSSFIRPERSAEECMAHIARCNPGSSWVELEPRVWQWKEAQRSES